MCVGIFLKDPKIGCVRGVSGKRQWVYLLPRFSPINVRARCVSLLEGLSGVVGKPLIPNSGRHDDTYKMRNQCYEVSVRPCRRGGVQRLDGVRTGVRGREALTWA